MELPEDVIRLIRDFSQPITRSNWRTLHRMTDEQFHMDAMKRFNKQFYDELHSPFNCIVHYRYMVFKADFYYIRTPNVLK
jgi:hypothetical protein